MFKFNRAPFIVVSCLASALSMAGCNHAPQKAVAPQETASPSTSIIKVPDERAAPSGLIAVATAYTPELKALLPHLEDAKMQKMNGVEFWSGNMNGQDIILFETGVSIVNATMNTQLMLDNFDVNAIVVSGIAGGLSPELSIGDVTVASDWGKYSEAAYLRELAPGDYVAHPGVEPMFDSFEFMGPRGVRIASSSDSSPSPRFWFAADKSLIEIAHRASDQLELQRCDSGGQCLSTTPEVRFDVKGVTGSVFMDNSEYREYLHQTFDAHVVEMETAAIAMVAHANDVPYIAFRSLSDLAGGGNADSNEMDAFETLAAQNAATLVRAFLTEYSSSSDFTAPASKIGDDLVTCEINYTSAPYRPGNTLNEVQRAKLEKYIENASAARAFYTSLNDLTEEALRIATDSEAIQQSFTIKEVWGGYKGKTQPSMAARLSVPTSADRDIAVRIGAAIGHLYIQNGLIVHCDSDEQDSYTIPAFSLIEGASSDVLSLSTIASVHGMMIGNAGGETELGFTYYPDEDSFFSLGFLDGGEVERLALEAVQRDLMKLSKNDASLTLSEEQRWSTYLGNDWVEAPDGVNYLAAGGFDAEELASLKALRDRYTQRLESFEFD